jgi:thiosulfate/3-mercaptopyruvate sulfurtransferase
MSVFTTLITVQELAAHIDHANWVIVDCRHDLIDSHAGRVAYNSGHIPKAQFAHLDIDLSGNKLDGNGAFRGRHPLPDKAAFIATLRSWGIHPASQIVTYDAQGGMYAARLWWMLRWVGHQAVAVLNGGYPAWLAANQATTTYMPSTKPGTIREQASLASVVNVQAVQANIQSGEKILVDARSPDRFRGENETIDPVGGHIPGAVNRCFKDNLQENGNFKSVQQLQTEWQLVVREANNAIMQCGSGVTACHNLLALEVANMPGAALYPGSWSEWCADPKRPVAVGDEQLVSQA